MRRIFLASSSPPEPHLDPQRQENAKNFRTCPSNSKYWLIDLNFLNVNVEKLKIEIWNNFLCPLHGDRSSDKFSQMSSKHSVSHHLCFVSENVIKWTVCLTKIEYSWLTTFQYQSQTFPIHSRISWTSLVQIQDILLNHIKLVNLCIYIILTRLEILL